MTRAVIVFLGLLCLLLGSCTQRMICPAYQSAFIYDQDELRKKFSYFQKDDSTPKVYTASKNKYLVAEQVSYQKKIRSMQTVKMKPVPVQVPDSLINADSVSMEELDRAARSVIDSTFIVDVPRDSIARQPDTVYVISKDKEVRLLKYNAPDSLDYDSATQKYVAQTPEYYVKEVRYQMEQDNYMWYLRDAIVLPDVRLAKLQQTEGGGDGKGSTKKSGKKKQGLKGFFKNLFKKKPKEQIDTTDLRPAPADDFDYVDPSDTTSQAEIPQPKQQQKKGLFKKKKSRDKVSKKKDKKPQGDEPAPADKKKEEDDGF